MALESVRVIVITGRNAHLREMLEGLGESARKLRVEGFVDDMASYLAACDVAIGKAGPASVFEALAVGRPVLVTGYAGLNEWAVVEFLERHRLGHYLPQSAGLAREVARYRAEPERLEEIGASCRSLHLAAMTEQLAHYVVSYARGGPPGDRLLAGGLP